jgi:uncharacterized membrane-anchored protein
LYFVWVRHITLGLTESDTIRHFPVPKTTPMTYSRKSDSDINFCTPVRSKNGSIRHNCKFYYVSQTESDLYRKKLYGSDRVRVRLNLTESDIVKKGQTESD